MWNVTRGMPVPPTKKKKKVVKKVAEVEKVAKVEEKSPGQLTPKEWAEDHPPELASCRPEWFKTLNLPEWAKGLRPWQVTAVDDIINAFRGGFKFVFLEAPTGAGKTLIAEAVRQRLSAELAQMNVEAQKGRVTCLDDNFCVFCNRELLNEKSKAMGYGPICAVKFDLPWKRYPTPEEVGLALGKLNGDAGPACNWVDPRTARACYVATTKSLQDQFIKDFPYAKVIKGRANYPTELAPERFDSKFSPVSCGECDYNPESRECSWCSGFSSCPYVCTKTEAERANLATLNTAYFMAVCKAGSEDKSGKMGFGMRDLVILDEGDLLESQIMGQVEISVSKREMEAMKLSPPTKKTVPETWIAWINEVALPAFEGKLERLLLDKSMDKIKRIKALKSVGSRINKLVSVRHEIAEDPNSWIYDGYKNGSVTFKPVKISEYGYEQLWKFCKRALVMSATFLTPKVYANDLGVDTNQVKVVTVPSSFPVQQRPVVLRKVEANTLTNRGIAWPRICNATADLCRDNPNLPTLVHAVSYKFAEELTYKLSNSKLDRPVFTYSNASERELALKEFSNNPNSPIIVAPSFDRGIDLHGDLCRLQIVAKVPFLNLGDKQVNSRMFSGGGKEWYAAQAIRTLVQMTGRAMRKPDDWCWTYILDSSISRLIMDWRHLFPKWWLASVVKDGFLGMNATEAARKNG